MGNKQIENEDFVICKWCNKKVKRIYGKHIKIHHPGKTSQDYKKEFPGSLLTSKADKQSTSKNSGQFMKLPEYREKYRQMALGRKNPNHKSNTTKLERQERSPFSKKFKNYESEKERDAFVKIALKDRITETQLEYWVNKGYPLNEAIEKHKERQRTFTKEKCIAKYGEDEGLKIWNNRQIKWSEKIETKYKNGDFTRFCKNNYSKTELIFINDLVEQLKPIEKFYSAINGKQFFRHFKETGTTHSYDFVLGKKIIEFNGDYWHCNPKNYEAEDFNKSIQLKAKERWGIDKKKIDLIESKGYEVKVIWESDYNNDPNKVINECIDFLKK